MKKVLGYFLIYVAVIFELIVIFYFVTQSGRLSEELGESPDEIGSWIGKLIGFIFLSAPAVLLFWVGKRLTRRSVNTKAE